jgi:hypothetical protein
MESRIMRYAVILVIGLLVGVIAGTTSARFLGQRNPYPKALMTVMKHELASATRAAESTDCRQGDVALDKLALLADDIIVAMPDDGPPDRVFHLYIDNLGKRVDAARLTECAQRAHAVTEIKNACSDCHRDYK